MLLSGCAHRAAHVNTPLAPARIGTTETGVASWYGFPYHGRRAASGEVYDMRATHRRAPQAPVPDLGRGHESLQRKTSGRPHQRSWSLCERAHPRSLASRRARHRHAPRRNRSRAPESNRHRPRIETLTTTGQRNRRRRRFPVTATPAIRARPRSTPAACGSAIASDWFAVQAGAFSTATAPNPCAPLSKTTLRRSPHRSPRDASLHSGA